jgi:hypothetical protein
MRLFDFLFEEVVDEEPVRKPGAAPAGTVPVRHKTPSFNIVLDTKESGKTVSWGEDGLDMRGIKQRFAPNASTGGAILEGVQFVGSFSAIVTAQTPELLSLRFTETDKALRKRLAAGPVKKPVKQPR